MSFVAVALSSFQKNFSSTALRARPRFVFGYKSCRVASETDNPTLPQIKSQIFKFTPSKRSFVASVAPSVRNGGDSSPRTGGKARLISVSRRADKSRRQCRRQFSEADLFGRHCNPPSAESCRYLHPSSASSITRMLPPALASPSCHSHSLGYRVLYNEDGRHAS